MATAPLKGPNYLSRLNLNAGFAPGGPWLQAALGGNVFAMSTSGSVTLPQNAATLASTFTLYNPAGSGKVVELIEVALSFNAAPLVVNGYAMAWQANVSAAGAPTSTTAVDNGPSSTLVGLGLTSVCNGYKAATLTNAAVLPWIHLGWEVTGTTAAYVAPSGFSYAFEGKLLLPPDSLVTLVMSKAAEASSAPSLVWAEWAL